MREAAGARLPSGFFTKCSPGTALSHVGLAMDQFSWVYQRDESL
jgi:hypothetical protein